MSELRNRVVQVSRFGGPEGLEVVEGPLPMPRRGEVRVRVLASGLEYTDVLIRRHLYPQTSRQRPPFALGYDFVGEVDAVGEGVSEFRVGDRVADMTVVGSNAAYRTIRADRLTRVPPGVDAAEAATLILSWTTAYQMLHRAAHVKRGQRVLVHGAAGAVGQALIVLGRLAGVEAWGAARGSHAGLMLELEARPIDYDRQDFARVVPGGFDVVFDGIGEGGFDARSRPSSAAACCALRLLRGGAGRAPHGDDADVDRAPLSLALVPGRPARELLFRERDSRAPSGVVPRGSRGPLPPAREPRHPPARRQAHRLRRSGRGAPPPRGRWARRQGGALSVSRRSHLPIGCFSARCARPASEASAR